MNTLALSTAPFAAVAAYVLQIVEGCRAMMTLHPSTFKHGVTMSLYNTAGQLAAEPFDPAIAGSNDVGISDGVHVDHFCEHQGCKKWGSFGFASMRNEPIVWHCSEHYPHW